MKRTIIFCLILAAGLLPHSAEAAREPRPVTAAELGFTVQKAISVGFTTEPIDMVSNLGFDSHLSFNAAIVWGTTTEVEIQLLGSDRETGHYYTAQRCTSAAVHLCKPRRWNFNAADGTVPSLDFETINHRWIKIVIVAGAGNGTIKGTATRGE